MKKTMVALGLALGVGMFACAVEPTDDGSTSSESALDSRPASPGVQNGGGCKVTSGPNAGKTGTYDTVNDPGHTWCCTGKDGTGSCTECTASGGGACTATAVAPPPRRVYDFGGTVGSISLSP